MTDAIRQALQTVFLDPGLWAIMLASAVYGVFIGAVPGLTATMAVALLVPVTYWMEPLPALAAITTMVACAIFAGDIPTVLLRIPGTPASAAYADDAYAFTLRGEPDRAMGIALTSSVLGGLFGALVLIVLGHQLARMAAWFSVAEYFWLYMLGLSCGVVVAHGSLLKAGFALLLGLLLSTVGLSAVHTQARFTFGEPELYQGINFIPAMIGLFGVSEILKNLLVLDPSAPGPAPVAPPADGGGPWGRRMARSVGGMFGPALRLIGGRLRAFVRASSIGTLIGILPGAGADIASWVSLAASRRAARGRDPEGAGGLSDATAANNAALAGAWIPALVFGIPGDSVTAIVIGVLLMKNLRPGPEIFEKQAVLVYSLYLIFLLGNLVLLPVGWLAIKAGGYVVRVPRKVLLPIILLYCVLGSFAINGSAFDVGLMLVMGLAGFALERRAIPLGPIVLGLILGGPLEERLIQTLAGSDGSPLAFVNRPIAAALGLAWAGLWASTLALAAVRRAGPAGPAPAPGNGNT